MIIIKEALHGVYGEANLIAPINHTVLGKKIKKADPND
jgi:hypothetical protein